MIKVMIVDDEEIVRLGLHALADWESHGFSLCYDAANGLAALEILKENSDIQIVMVDMQMPKMDGLRFLEEVKRLNLPIQVIVLSAHDRYDIIRQAFRLGISDYIVKFEMNEEEILRQLKNAAAKLESFKTTGTSLKEREKLRLKEKYLADLLSNISGEIETDYADTLDIDSSFSYFCTASILAENQTEFENKISIMHNIAKDITMPGLYIGLAPIAQGEAGMLFAFKTKSMAEIGTDMEAILRKFRSHLENYTNLNITICAGNIVRSLERIGEEYKAARKNADMRFVLGQGKIIFPWDVKGIASDDIGSMTSITRKIILTFKEGDENAIKAELNAAFEAISRYNPEKIEKIFPYYIELLFSIMLYLDELGVNISDIFRRNVNFYEEIHKFKTRSELNNWMRNIVSWIYDYLKERNNADLTRPVAMAKDFITKNYYDKTLSLNMVSSYVGVSENHLSSIFPKQTGKTFTEYVTEMRIEKAKVLLRGTNLKVYEIAESVGFANAEYFSKIFKKVTGKSPNQFK